MKILHYTIGFAPERTGGLVNYATDLMREQRNQGHDVVALYPASQLFFLKSPKIRKTSNKFGVEAYILLNSLPLALFGGIANPKDFTVPVDKQSFKSFLKKIQPEIVHVHSLIGLHKEFLEVAKELGIKIVYTTHDYYGLAPLPNFYYGGKSFDEDNSNLAWNIMSADALTTNKLRVFQSSLYPIVRSVLKKLNKNPKHKVYQNISTISETIDYDEIRQYYIDMLSNVDFFHFNSSLTESVYKKNLPFDIQGKVVSITNSSIKEHNIVKRPKEKEVVAYIGPDEEYKGYFDFLDFAKTFDLSKYQIKTYGHVPNNFAPDFINQMGRFDKNQVDDVYSEIDYLIVPSRWKETFGLVVLEALSYGVSVFASENIGSKDLLDNKFIFSEVSEIKLISKSRDKVSVKMMKSHAEELINMYSFIEV